MSMFWEAEQHLLVKDQAKSFTYVVEDVEDVHIMYAKRDVQLVGMEKLQQ